MIHTLVTWLTGLLGASILYGGMFILLFTIVEFVAFLRLFPVAKYLTPFLLGVIWVERGYTGGLRDGFPYFYGSENVTLCVMAICVGLAFWYMVGGIERGQKALERSGPPTQDT